MDIKDTVRIYPHLLLQVNKGNRHRIINSSIDKGSLWVKARIRHGDNYVEVTGNAESKLYSFLQNNFGVHDGENQGKKYWYLSDSDLKKAIEYYAL